MKSAVKTIADIIMKIATGLPPILMFSPPH